MSSTNRVVLVQYFASEFRVLAFVVREGLSSPEVIDIGVDPKRIGDYCESGFSGASLENLDLFDWREWQALLAPLMEPIAKWTSPGETVWIVPDGFLHSLPLHALTVDGVVLAERNPVCYTPSASTMVYCARKRTGRRVRAASFGDSLSDLPQGREESRMLAGAFGVEPLVGDKVTRSNVMRILVGEGNLDVVHFACHIVFDAVEPLRSGIVLAREGGDDETRIPRLSAQEILNLPLSADLVLLSGCVSGASVRKPGDELLGLGRAWLYAGAASVLASLWPVDDLASGILMARFASELGLGADAQNPGVTKAEALRRSQSYVKNLTQEEFRAWELVHLENLQRGVSEIPPGRSFLATGDAIASGELPAQTEAPSRARSINMLRASGNCPFANPYYWAPFVLIGDHL